MKTASETSWELDLGRNMQTPAIRPIRAVAGAGGLDRE